MGWLGLIFFIVLFLVGIIVIIKGNHKKKIYYLALYISIYLHSLLDFDFAYLFTFLALVSIVAFAGNINHEVKLKNKLVSISIVIIGIYILFISTIAYLGEYSYEKEKYNTVVTLGKLIDFLTVSKDVNGKELVFKGYIGIGVKDGDKEKIEEGIKIIEDIAGSKHKTSYIYYDLALSYKEIGDKEKASYYFEKLLEIQKYNSQVYQVYCSLYSDDENKQNEIMDRYNKVNDGRTERSKEIFK
jgi:tetratricopeptide (TPR) repeat protein